MSSLFSKISRLEKQIFNIDIIQLVFIAIRPV